MKNLMNKGLGIIVIMLSFLACTNKAAPEGESPSGTSSLDIIFTPPSLEMEPGESAEVSYRFSQIVTSPRIVLIPVDGLQMSSAQDPGGQSGKIQVSLSADVALGTVLKATVVAADGDNSVQKTLEVKAVEQGQGQGPGQPQNPSGTRKIRTIRYSDGKDVSIIRFEYDSQSRAKAAACYYDGGSIPITYSYPTQSTVTVTVGNFSSTCFISGGKLVSVTEQDGDKTSFEYDSNGRLASYNDIVCSWTGDDLTSMKHGDGYSFEIKYTSSQDLYGASFILVTGGLSEMEAGALLPVISGLSGLNSAHLPSSVQYASSWSSNTSHFDYSIDASGYIKTIIDDSGNIVNIWYTDEPESADENLGGGGQGGGGGEDGPETGSSAWSVIGDVMDSGWSRDYYGVDLGGGIVALKNVTLTSSDQFKWRKNGSWNENYGGVFESLNTGFSVKYAGEDITPYLSGTYDLYLNTSLSQAAVCTRGTAPTWSSSPSDNIMDVSGAQFLAAQPSSTQLYRLRGAIGLITNSTYGNVVICTEDGQYVSIYGISSSPIGYGGTTDRTFPNHRLRVGDEVTVVGYAYSYNGSNEMNYGYLESSYRLQASDFAGTYSVFSDMIEYEDTFVEWTGVTVEVPTNGYMLFQGMSYYKDDDWVDTSAVALGEYDDETGTVKLLDSWFNRNYYWWYNSAPDQKYISIFYTVKADNSAQSYTWADSDLVLRPSGYLRSSTGFGLDRAGSAEESQYIFLDHYYDPDSGEVGEGTYRSDIFQFYFMLKRSESVNSPALHRSLNKESVRKAQIPQSGKKVPMGFSR